MMVCKINTTADINECLPGAVGNTTCEQVCVNTPGSYHCACFLGWRLTANLITCEGTCN